MPGYKLPPLMFTDDEAAAVVLGLLTAGRLGLPMAGTASALAKVQRVLPTALGLRIEALRHTLGFTMRQADVAAPDIGTVLMLAQAAGQRQRVRLRYRSWAGSDSERDVDPYGLVLHSGALVCQRARFAQRPDPDIPRRPGDVRAAGRGNVRAARGF
jgi:predicted DNA-binding transcriptional regulator YafY